MPIPMVDHRELIEVINCAVDAIAVTTCTVPDPPGLILIATVTKDGLVVIKAKSALDGPYANKQGPVAQTVKKAIVAELHLITRGDHAKG